MTKLRFFCPRGSTSLMKLIRGLRAQGSNSLRIKRRGSTYQYPSSHTIISWGSSQCPSVAFNSNESIANSSSKVVTFELLKEAGVPCVPFTVDKEVAKQWITEEDSIVFCRTLTRSSQGKGIVVAESVDELVQAPLYTKYIEVPREIRIHVFQGRVIDFSQKRKLSSESREERGLEGEADEYIRNLENGWIFARLGIEVPEAAKEVAIQSVAALDLDFGAVDMIISEEREPYTLEVNSAPGLEGTTLEKYVEAFGSL